MLAPNAQPKYRADHLLIAEMVARGARVLDVGCGDGSLLQLLTDTKEVDGRGIEVSRERVNACVARGLSVIQGDADRAAIVAANDVLHQAIRNDDPVTYHRHSRDFHIAITRPSRMYRLLHMLESAWNVTEPVQSMVHVAASDRELLQTDHSDMLEAFLEGDAELLIEISQRHARRLNAVIATLPTDTGLLAPPDISFVQ